jgi:predicted nucleic acid-binding protein
MLVVSDTSPIRALHHVALVPVLLALYGRVLVPPAVAQELARGSATSPVVDLSAYPHVVTLAPARLDPRAASDPDLDLGELEAISLALELGAIDC